MHRYLLAMLVFSLCTFSLRHQSIGLDLKIHQIQLENYHERSTYEKDFHELNNYQHNSQETAKQKTWRTQLLKDVTQLKVVGAPAKSVVFGDNAAVIVSAGQTDVIISAAQLGKGRIVMITHDGYLNGFTQTNEDANIQKLHANIKKWITKNKFKSNSDLSKASDWVKLSSPSPVKGLYTTQPIQTWTQAQKSKILQFVKNGGGLFVATCSWGWAQLSGTTDFTKLLTYKTLIQSGMLYTNDVAKSVQKYNTNNQNAYKAHFGINLQIALSPQKQGINYSNVVAVGDQARYIPDSYKSKLRAKVQKSFSNQQIQSIAPSESNPTKSPYNRCRLIYYKNLVLDGNRPNVVAPKYELFPRKVSKVICKNQSLTFNAPLFQEFHQTGLYAVAGKPVTIKVEGAIPSSEWDIMIGFHYDNNADLDQWVRWPTVYTQRKINSNSFQIVSPYGGLIVLRNPKSSTATTLKIKITGAVESPFYDSQNPASIKDWPRRKNTFGAWGCAQGLYVAFCMPAASFKGLDDPSKVLNIYDNLYIQYHSLKGTDPKHQRKRFIVSDIKPHNGYMHSGYPIVTMLDVADPKNKDFIFNLDHLKSQGSWGVFHQLGHNMQQDAWTYDGTVEVTCNIFSLKAINIVTGSTPKHAKWLNDQKDNAKKYLEHPSFQVWKEDPGVALFIYAQVIQDFGWDMLKKVFKYYQTTDAGNLPKQNQDKIDTFWSRVSIQSGHNLTPLLKKWGIPFTNKFTDAVHSLPAYTQKVNLLD